MIPTTMSAAILVQQHQPLIVDTVSLPETLAVGQVLVKVAYSGICGSQLGEIDGVKGPDRYLPHLFGHEGAGEVIAIGPGVTGVAAGDTVVMHWRKGPGINAKPPLYQWKGAALNAGQVTTLSEFAIVAENRLTTVPADSDPQLLPLFGCAVTTGFGIVCNNAQLTIGQSLVVLGAGGIGLNVIQAAAMVSAYPIVAVDLVPGRLELARQMGATHLLDGRDPELESKIHSLAPAADAVVDNTGNTSVIEMGYRLTGPAGRLILVGVPAAGKDISIHSLPMHFGKSIVGCHGGDCQPHEDIPRLLRLAAAGRLNLAPLITDHTDLANINHAISKMRDGSSKGRWLIHMEA
jgi:S-(hydroxymethyl)glutathione dehydrogenase / alcohol dehydrogenase